MKYFRGPRRCRMPVRQERGKTGSAEPQHLPRGAAVLGFHGPELGGVVPVSIRIGHDPVDLLPEKGAGHRFQAAAGGVMHILHKAARENGTVVVQ